MCGITGILAFNEIGRMQLIHLENTTRILEKRGPDHHDTFLDQFVGLGHRRLSIIDTSSAGHQPMTDPSGRYTIIFNGEIYNYRELKKDLVNQGIAFDSSSDTEVLLQLFIKEGKSCLEKLNGFFAFAIFDKAENSLFIARDRVGIKPLLYYQDEDKFLFASEMKSLLEYGIPREINEEALRMYLELNYLPAPFTMLKGIRKLEPGHWLTIKGREVNSQQWYHIPKPGEKVFNGNYDDAKKTLQGTLDESVMRRLVADVPLGAFLSGGIDSSIVTALASRHVEQLNTFSIGYRDDKFFDETHYAEVVAKKFKTNHTVFSLTQNDLLDHLPDILNYIDDPFADSSALPVYILSKETRKYATVALSGDGADELFSGYNKHAAWLRASQGGLGNSLVKSTGWLWSMMPKSRSGKIGNKFRQLERFSKMLNCNVNDRYWFLATFQQLKEVEKLLTNQKIDLTTYNEVKKRYLESVDPSIGSMLYTDCQLVLPNDMLTKVDLMSMANHLEVRVPFLDHNLIEFVNSLPDDFKINSSLRKRILQDTFREILPLELYNRPKKGFEVPLLSWFKGELQGDLNRTLFNEELLSSQDIFKPKQVMQLKKRINSYNPADAHAKVWALFVFQHWYKRVFQ